MGLVVNDLCENQEIRFTGGITVQTHHTALVLAEQGFGPAIVDVYTAASHRPEKLSIHPILGSPQVHLSALWARDSQAIMLTKYLVQCVREAALEIGLEYLSA